MHDAVPQRRVREVPQVEDIADLHPVPDGPADLLRVFLKHRGDASSHDSETHYGDLFHSDLDSDPPGRSVLSGRSPGARFPNNI